MSEKKPPDVAAAGGPLAGHTEPIPGPGGDGASEPSAARIPPWRRFPTEALPPACRRLVLEAARARGVDPACVGVLMLPVLAGAIGNARVLRLKRAYTEPAVLWAALVQRSGTIKSAGLVDVLRPHRERNHRLLEETERALAKYDQDLARHRKAKNNLPPPPNRPLRQAVLVDDVTAEALIARLADNPRGLLLGVDELAGLIASFDAYKHARGADVNKYLTMHLAGPLRSDRKGGDRPTIYVPRAALSIAGTIQPRTLARVMGSDNIENGLLARLLVAMPPTPRGHWSEADVALETYRGWERVVNGLLDLECDDEPRELRLSEGARSVWIRFHDAMVDRGNREDDQLAAALSKLRGGALRNALVLALALAAEEGRASGLLVVDRRALEGGIALAEFFANEAERVYAALNARPDEQADSRAWEFVAQRGGRITVRDLARHGPRSCRGSGAAEARLMAWVKAGRGRWEDVPSEATGGAPTREFVQREPLNLGDRCDTTPELLGNLGVPSRRSHVESFAQAAGEPPAAEPDHGSAAPLTEPTHVSDPTGPGPPSREPSAEPTSPSHDGRGDVATIAPTTAPPSETAFRCPTCGGELRASNSSSRTCTACGTRFGDAYLRSLEPPTAPCRHCSGRFFWRPRRGTPYVCERCQPPASERLVAERVEVRP